MTLQTGAFKHGKKINGYGVVVMDELRERRPEKFIESGQMDWKWFEGEVRPVNNIFIRHDKNSVSFSRCDEETIIKAVIKMLRKKCEAMVLPDSICRVGDAIQHLEMAFDELDDAMGEK